MVTKSKRRAAKKSKAVQAKPLQADRMQPANGNGALVSDHDVLRRMYVSMLKCRMMRERACPSSGSAFANDSGFGAGDEAILVGATLELGPEDTIVTISHNCAVQATNGASLEHLFSPQAHKNGNEAVVATEGSLASAVSFDPFNLATGLALAHRLEKKRNVVVALGIEGSAASDGWHEAMKFAGIHKLPVIYVLKSRSAFEFGPDRKTPALEDLSFMTREGGFPAIVVDSNDAVAVRRAAYESIHRARNGAGPTLIECDTKFARSGDPLAHMEHYMKKRGAWDDEWRRYAADRIEAEVETASALVG